MPTKRRRGEASTSQNLDPPSNPEEGESPEPPELPPLPRNYQDNPPVPPNFSEKKRQLANRQFRTTLFYDQHTCTSLGVDDMVRQLASNLGFDGFLDIRIPNDHITTDEAYGAPEQPPLTYKCLTLEFLSTFDMREEDDEVSGRKSHAISFRMFGKYRKLTLRRLNQIFGWDPEARMIAINGKKEEGYDASTWWDMITSGEFEYNPSTSKASEILHLALRYLHRMLSYCFFSRQEMGRVTKPDNYLLWKAVHGSSQEDKSKKINLGYLLADQIKKVRNDEKRTGPIYFGGMITWIALELGFHGELKQLEPLKYKSALSADPLMNMTFIVESDSELEQGFDYIWLVREKPWCYLPCSFMSTPPTGEGVNPWQVPMGYIHPNELTKEDREWRAHQQPLQQPPQQHQQQQQSQPRQYHRRNRPPAQAREDAGPSSRPSISEGGTSSSSLDMQSLGSSLANLSLQVTQLNENVSSFVNRAPSPIYQWHMYDHFVDQGLISPPVNYPYDPPQYGPVPNWTPRRYDSEGREIPKAGGTYPYWEGPGSLHRPPTPKPPFNYTLPGGCDYRGDPAYPYVSNDPEHPFPPGYAGWGEGCPPPYLGDTDAQDHH